MPNFSNCYSGIRFDFWGSPFITVENDYISSFCLHNVRQDWQWDQGGFYQIRFECDGCYFVFRPANCQDCNQSYSEGLREHLKQNMTEFLERIQTPDLWQVSILDQDGARHPVHLPVVPEPYESGGTLTNTLQTVHIAENGWAYVILGSKEYTERCVQRFAWVDDARTDGQPTIME